MKWNSFSRSCCSGMLHRPVPQLSWEYPHCWSHIRVTPASIPTGSTDAGQWFIYTEYLVFKCEVRAQVSELLQSASWNLRREKTIRGPQARNFANSYILFFFQLANGETELALIWLLLEAADIVSAILSRLMLARQLIVKVRLADIFENSQAFKSPLSIPIDLDN